MNNLMISCVTRRSFFIFNLENLAGLKAFSFFAQLPARFSYFRRLKMTYQEKLKDPRWQRKRLEILKRDDFCCQHCYDSESTLHVHHKIYSKGEPWDAKPETLVTLCAECHDIEHKTRGDNIKLLDKALKLSDISSGLIEIIEAGFLESNFSYPPDVIVSMIHSLLVHPSIQDAVLKLMHPPEFYNGE